MRHIFVKTENPKNFSFYLKILYCFVLVDHITYKEVCGSPVL